LDDSEKPLNPLDRLIADLASPLAAVRQEAFGALCARTSSGDMDFAGKKLLARGDTQSLYWLIEYLLALATPEALEKFGELLAHDSETVRIQARNAVGRVEDRARSELLLALLGSPREDDLRFAARMLGEWPVAKAVHPLLALLGTHDDPLVRLEVVRTLERLRNPLAITPLTRIASRERGELQETAFRAAVGLLLEQGRPSVLKKFARSERPIIRQIAYLSMLKLRGRRWEHFVASSLDSGEDETVKVGVLSALRAMQTRRLFRAVFACALADPSLTVRLMAQSVLKRVKAKHVLGCLLMETRRGVPASQELAVRVTAEYYQAPDAARGLVRLFGNTRDFRLKLIGLGALGEIRSRSAAPFLLRLLKSQDKTACAAAQAYVKIAGPRDWAEIRQCLDDPRVSIPVKSVFLGLVAHLPQTAPIPEGVRACLERLSGHSDRSLRYLALRAQGRFDGSDLVLKLLTVAARDTEASVRDAAVRSLCEILGRDPRQLGFAASVSVSFPEAAHAVRQIFRRASVKTEAHFRAIVESVLALVRKHLSEPTRGRPFDATRLLLLIRHLAKSEKVIFLNCLRDAGRGPVERCWLLKVLQRTGLHAYPGLDFGFMIEDYPRADSACKREYLRFARRFSETGAPLRRLLCDALGWEADEEFRVGIYELLNRQWDQSGVTSGRGAP